MSYIRAFADLCQGIVEFAIFRFWILKKRQQQHRPIENGKRANSCIAEYIGKICTTQTVENTLLLVLRSLGENGSSHT